MHIFSVVHSASCWRLCVVLCCGFWQRYVLFSFIVVRCQEEEEKKKYRRSSVIVSVYVHTHLYIKVSLLSASLCFAVSQCDDKRREQQQPPKLLNGKRWKVFMGVSW